MHTRTAITAAVLLLAALTGCGSGESSTSKPDKKPSTASVSTAPTYTQADCRALLEKGYEAGAPKDVSAKPECAGLTRDQYVGLVGQVLRGHKDDILEQAAWDTAWDGLDADAQASVCSLLQSSGPQAAEGLTEEQAQYFLDHKC